MRELIEEMEFHPVRNKQFLLDWMDNISIDWPISGEDGITQKFQFGIPKMVQNNYSTIKTYVQPWRENHLLVAVC